MDNRTKTDEMSAGRNHLIGIPWSSSLASIKLEQGRAHSLPRWVGGRNCSRLSDQGRGSSDGKSRSNRRGRGRGRRAKKSAPRLFLPGCSPSLVNRRGEEPQSQENGLSSIAVPRRRLPSLRTLL
jgi:hypothetical protein